MICNDPIPKGVAFPGVTYFLSLRLDHRVVVRTVAGKQGARATRYMICVISVNPATTDSCLACV